MQLSAFLSSRAEWRVNKVALHKLVDDTTAPRVSHRLPLRAGSCGRAKPGCGKLMASIENKSWTGALRHFTFGNGSEQAWLE
jgi:hypothetical protein